jgi:hypothetical protein
MIVRRLVQLPKFPIVAPLALFVACFALGFALPAVASNIQQIAYNLITDESTPIARSSTLNFTGAGVTCAQASAVTECNIPAGSATQQHVITFSIDGGGSAITTGDLAVFPVAAFACTINRVDVSADQSGSITVDIWNRSAAIPTAANKISASAPATLSSAQLSLNGSLTGWTTSVSSGSVFGATVATASTVQKVTVQIWCS